MGLTMTRGEHLKRILSLLAPYKLKQVQTFLCMIVNVALGLLLPLILRFLIDDVIKEKRADLLAPLVFVKLPKETAGTFMRAAFPVYYLVLAGVTAIAALLAGMRAEAWALWFVVALFLILRFWLIPGLDRVRGKDQPAFARLHRLSVAANAVQLVVLILVAIRLTA